MQLQIIHRRRPRVFEGVQAPVFSTCLRSLAFTAAESAEPDDEIYSQAAAYSFLLEVICGLHSPIVGETEVFGQFKTFAKDWLKQDEKRGPLIQRLFNDAKEIRTRYLSGLGHQSYGSWLRKRVQGSDVHILGAGQLVQEIAPHLVKVARSVIVHARRPEQVKIINVEIRSLARRTFEAGTLIVAAPMTSNEIQLWMGERTPHVIYDLRADSSLDSIDNRASRIVLDQLFAEIEANKSRLIPIVEQVKNEIQNCGRRWLTQEFVRPQGWDDLCA
ncbi:MAG: hypothetical protein AB7F86_15975 [Bdellovibrionales bacterium]